MILSLATHHTGRGIRRMAKPVPPIYQFRDKWGTANAGYVVAGEVQRKPWFVGRLHPGKLF